MRRHVDARNAHSERHIDNHKGQASASQRRQQRCRQDPPLPKAETEQTTDDAEDRSGCTSANPVQVPKQAGQTSQQPGRHIGQRKANVAEQPLDKRTQRPKRPHIQQQMDHADVQKRCGEQPPRLARKNFTRAQRPPTSQIGHRGIGQADAAEDHQGKDGHIDGDQNPIEHGIRRPHC
jgi:hypothetical protein